MLWDGAFLSDEYAFSHLLSNPAPSLAAAEINRYLDTVATGQTPKDLSGVFGAARISDDGSFIIAPDPLSQYAFFQLDRGGHRIFSNSLHLIEKACHLLGLPMKRDFASNAFEAAFGMGGWVKTGLESVEKLPPGYAAICDGRQLDLKRFSSPWKQDTGDYLDHAQAAATGLMNRAKSLANTLPDKGIVLDLSGGKDTRVVLGSFLGASVKNFHVFPGGSHDGTDRHIAYQLINHLGLKRSTFPSNVGPDEVIDPISAAARAAYRSMGSSNLYHASLGTERINNMVQVRGGCAEGRTKSFLLTPSQRQQMKMLAYLDATEGNTGWISRIQKRVGNHFASFATCYIAQLMRRGCYAHGLFTPDFLQNAVSAFRYQIEWLLNEGIGETDLRDAHYIYDRGWRHAGFTVQVMNDCRPTFEPLNDVRLIAAQSKLSSGDRDQAKLSFDLLTRFDTPGLTELPFADTDWPNQLLSSAQKAVRADLANTSAQPIEPELILARRGKSNDINNIGRLAFMAAVQDHFLELASGIEASSEVWHMLNRESLLEAIRVGNFTEQKFAALGSRLYHGLVWVTGQEERTILE